MGESHNIPAVLLAGGLGTRLRPLTDSIPKALAPIGDTPLLGIWLSLLSKAGVGPMVVNLHHHADAVRTFLHEGGWHQNVTASFEKELLGTGGTLLHHREMLQHGPFLAIHADNFSMFDVKEFITAHHNRPAGTMITMMTFTTPTPSSCGIVELDARGVVVAFHEKKQNPPGDLANGAVYIMEPEILDTLDECGAEFPDISMDVIPRYIDKIYTYHNDCYHRDIGTMESYAQAQKDLVGLIEAGVLQQYME
ncbi:nucleotidyltransferase family protein [Oceanidesulfovibrio marinus]|uniref:Nucleotidyltransferase family protein n=1 Tax=Oceanidesulfovibrio marinus TaxID=370038 RepID=A0ABX6NAK1_9BACT|nr:nucleotidyltransferase family protein [Oceanidesulfovibrio marinus]QJT07624.1 nucleotidyltransferase family protein [Oceanidesulfovibrio marinus]